MKRVIKNNYKIIIGFILGLIFSITSVYAIEAYIESSKVTYSNHNKTNVEEAIDELYERSGVHKEKWIDPILNGADPVLKDPIIPVEIKPNGDVYYANENSEWYNYSEKRWANAIILVDNPSNQNYQVGDHILESDIESYFVWIPRYQYKVWTLANSDEFKTINFGASLNNTGYNDSPALITNNSRIIDVKFGNVEAIPKMNESDAKLNEYYTHPAFTLGNKDLNGIWVGKFETGYKGAANKTSAQIDKIDSDKIIIKPNAHSWENMSIKNIFMTSYGYKKGNSEHNEVLDPHMIKNTEWGAVAYLSHSEYGIGTEVNINNNSDCITGYSAEANTNQSSVPGEYDNTTSKKSAPYNTRIGNLASTTGNITGVYDMSGGTMEIVAAYKDGAIPSSVFSTADLQKYSKYFDVYSTQSTVSSYDKRILGDATGEMGPFYAYYERNGDPYQHNSWYSDIADFVDTDRPWFIRGGYYGYGVISGQFYFDWHPGTSALDMGFRLTLSLLTN